MKSYKHIKAIKQPTQMSCWTTSMSWFTKAVAQLPNMDEQLIFGNFADLANNDESIDFPSKYKMFLENKRWGLTVTTDFSKMGLSADLEKTIKSPILCGHFDILVNGYHAKALYKHDGEWWAMDPRPGEHVQIDWGTLFRFKSTTVMAYRT